MNLLWAVDRETPPKNFVTLRQPRKHELTNYGPGAVFALSSPQQKGKQSTYGLICAQAPFGQGQTIYFVPHALRPATPEEVLEAIDRDHISGPEFLPDLTFLTLKHRSRLLSRWSQIAQRQRKTIWRQLQTSK